MMIYSIGLDIAAYTVLYFTVKHLYSNQVTSF